MPGDKYTQAELMAMSQAEFLDAQARDFFRPTTSIQLTLPSSTRNLVDQPLTVPAPEDPYAITGDWGQSEYDFLTPSGQRCRMKRLDLVQLTATGVLDRVTRLPGLAQAQIDLAEGKPPVKDDEMPSASQMEIITETVDLIVPLAVLRPKIWSLPKEGEERVEGRVYVDSIDLADRIAILDKALGGVTALDSFRK